MELQIPAGLTDMLQEFTVVVLREKPDDMVDFAANYFTNLKQQNRPGGNAKRLSFQSDQKLSDQDDEEEEEPLGTLSRPQIDCLPQHRQLLHNFSCCLPLSRH